MKVLTGCDIIEVSRIKEAMGTHGFKERVFTNTEIEYCDSKGEEIKYQHYAARFAAKEAVFKAISKELKSKFAIGWKNVEIVKDENDRPIVNLIDVDLDNKISIDVSISHVKEMAIATAIAMEEG